jgi:hypothetical protein
MVVRLSYHRTWAQYLVLLGSILLLGGCVPGSSKTPDTLRYDLPTAITIDVGKSLPGTQIIYEGQGENGANILINGQRALKRKGDSLYWKGNLANGVLADLRLRVAWYTDDALYVAGTARIDIEQARPTAGSISTSSPVKFGGAAAYRVRQGSTIPGSTVTYEEKMSEEARLGGIADYPYRKVGDSIFWEGTLREGVYIRLDLRLLQYDTRYMRAGGLVTLWIGS